MSYEDLRKAIKENNIKILEKHVSDGKVQYNLNNKQIKYPWYRPAKYFKLWDRWMHGDKLLLIDFQLDAGDWISFTIKIEETSFVFKGRKYLVDLSMMEYNRSAKMYYLTYHQSLALPIKREIHVEKIKDALDEKNVECRESLNPTNLQRYSKSSIIAQIFQGAELMSKVKEILTFIYIIVGAVVLIGIGVGFIIYQQAQAMGTI